MDLRKNEKEILSELQKNSRLTAAEISRKLGIARTTVNAVIARLEENVIDSYSVTLQEDAADSCVNCYVLITSDPKVMTLDAELEKIPEIKELRAVAGHIDMVAHVQADNHQALDDILVHIARLDGVIKTQTSIVLKTKFKR